MVCVRTCVHLNMTQTYFAWHVCVGRVKSGTCVCVCVRAFKYDANVFHVGCVCGTCQKCDVSKVERVCVYVRAFKHYANVFHVECVRGTCQKCDVSKMGRVCVCVHLNMTQM